MTELTKDEIYWLFEQLTLDKCGSDQADMCYAIREKMKEMLKEIEFEIGT